MGVYADALKVIKERGWTQGNYIGLHGGPVCIVGAIAIAKGVSPEELTETCYGDAPGDEVWGRTEEEQRCLIACARDLILGDKIELEGVHQLYNWNIVDVNDSPSTTQENIESILVLAEERCG